MKKDFFMECLGSLVIPAVETNCSLPACLNTSVILFCDNCSCHCTDDVGKELVIYGILLIIYPPSTSHICPVLDILLFGRLKAIKKQLLWDLSLHRDLDSNMRIFRAYERAVPSFTARSSWDKTGLRIKQEMRRLTSSLMSEKSVNRQFSLNNGQSITLRVAYHYAGGSNSERDSTNASFEWNIESSYRLMMFLS
jgi:hypothetical protein